MPISTEGLLVRLNPMSALDLRPDRGGGGGSSLERERLKLMREQFENQKKQQAEQARLDREAEAGRMARETMQGQRAKEAAEAARLAKRQESKQAALLDFSKMAGSGDAEGTRAMVPYMYSVGKGVELLGEEAGLPTYRTFDVDEQGNEIPSAQPGGIGLEEASGVMVEPAGIASTEDAFKQALGAYEHFEKTGAPLTATPQEDFTGGVPRDVIDMGAIQAQTMARLNPALSGLVDAYPEAYRQSARSTADAVSGLGLPAAKAVEQFGARRSGPDSLISSEIDAAATQGRFDQTQKVQASKESEDRFNTGFATIGKTMGSTYGVEDLITGRDQTAKALDILNNDKDSDDHLVLSLISRRMGERGATTEGDIKRVTGMSALAWIDQAKSWLEKGLEGGLPIDQKNALIGVLKEMQTSDASRFETFLGKLESEASNKETDPDVARGLRAYGRAFVPKDVREAYETKTKGDLKFVDQKGAEKGEAASDGGHWAKFATPEEGAAALRAQIEKDAGRGVTVREFVSKYAPPKSNDTEKYIADAVKELGAEEGTKLSDIDPERVAVFVARKESGTTLGASTSSKAPAAGDGAERLRALLKKGGY